jgi:Uma2 family endonuclease
MDQASPGESEVDNMSTTTRWTSRDLESLPDDGTRYEIIDGELFMSKQPHFYHQDVCMELSAVLWNWDKIANLGRVVGAPGLIFADDDDVAPDLVWISNDRLIASLKADGKLHDAPELVIEVLSPGSVNERRDREAKLKLYSRRGVSEYWIVSWQTRTVDVFRRQDDELKPIIILTENDALESSVLPGFSCPVSAIFARIPITRQGEPKV